jgi:hypothetical protein
MMATRETGADPSGHNEPGYHEPAQFDGDTRLHTGIVIVRFMLTVFSLVLLIPLAYLMRIRDWFGRTLKRRGTSRRAGRRFHFFKLSSSRH